MMEASLHRRSDKSSKSEANIYANWSMKLFILPLLLAIGLIGYVVSHPEAGRWIADGVQAEFAGSDRAWETSASTRLANH